MQLLITFQITRVIQALGPGGNVPLIYSLKVQINPNHNVVLTRMLLLSTQWGGTALLKAAEEGNADVIKILIAAGCDVHAKTVSLSWWHSEMLKRASPPMPPLLPCTVVFFVTVLVCLPLDPFT